MSEKPAHPASNVPPELEEKLAEQAILQQAVVEARQKAASAEDQLLRLRAEFENFRKRTEKEKAEARVWGKEEVLMPLLSLVDVFEHALEHSREAKEVAQVLQGLDILHKNFAGFLRAEGLEALELAGKPFDPHQAEAVEQVEVGPDQAGQVLKELQRGYRFRGRILRPARVRVGIAPAPAGGPEV